MIFTTSGKVRTLGILSYNYVYIKKMNIHAGLEDFVFSEYGGSEKRQRETMVCHAGLNPKQRQVASL